MLTRLRSKKITKPNYIQLNNGCIHPNLRGDDVVEAVVGKRTRISVTDVMQDIKGKFIKRLAASAQKPRELYLELIDEEDQPLSQ